MPLVSNWGTPLKTYSALSPDEIARRAAAGIGAGAAASSGAATAAGYGNQQASYGAAANASQTAGNVQYAPDGHILTEAEIRDRARAQGMGAAAAASSAGTNATWQGNLGANAGAMANASNAASRTAGAPMPAPNIPAPISGAPTNSVNLPYNTWENSQAYANPYAFNIPGYGQSNPMTSQGATMDNIRPYLNPFLDQIISQGTNAIEHSAAGRGLFGSTGNINDIGTWATNASSQAWNDAANRFTQDRGYFNDQDWTRYSAGAAAGNDAMNRMASDRGAMFDAYRYQNDANYRNYWDTYNANWNQYQYGNQDYLNRLGSYAAGNNGLLGAQQDATMRAMAIYSALGGDIAKLWGDRGNIGMQGATNQGNVNQSILSDIFGLLGGVFG